MKFDIFFWANVFCSNRRLPALHDMPQIQRTTMPVDEAIRDSMDRAAATWQLMCSVLGTRTQELKKHG
eukprot:750750-Amphidinium_carterae.1